MYGSQINKFFLSKNKNIYYYLPCKIETLLCNTFVPIADNGVFSKEEFWSVDLVTVKSSWETSETWGTSFISIDVEDGIFDKRQVMFFKSIIVFGFIASLSPDCRKETPEDDITCQTSL